MAGGIEAPEDEDGDETQAPTGVTGQTLSFASSAGYLALATEDSLLEDYLRAGENPPKPLRSVAGLAEAAQKAGGMENGFFSYENQAESLKVTFEAMKANPHLFSNVPLIGGAAEDEEEGSVARLFNPKLLPAFDQIAKYFGITVASAQTSADGFYVKAVAPKPAGLK